MKKIFSILFAAALVLAFSLVAAVPALPALANPGVTTVLVDNLDPSWDASGGGGVYSAYYGPEGYSAVSPGTTAFYDDREAAPIMAGINIDTVDDPETPSGHYWDQCLYAFKPGMTIDDLALLAISWDVEAQYGACPVWMYMELDKGGPNDVVYQHVPTTNPAGWHTVDAAAGLWQKWNNWDGDTTGNPLIPLSQVAADNTGLAASRCYLNVGMGDSYHDNPDGTVDWVDKVTIGEVTYDFVLAKYWYVATTGSDSNEGTEISPFLTIQHAIDSASPGDTIHVAAGTYNVDAESWQWWGTCIHVNKDNLHIKGAGSGSTVLDAQHAHSVLLPPANPNHLHCTVVWVQAQTCTIEGLTVKSGDYGIRANWNGPSTSLTLIDVVVDDNYGLGIVFENDITTATFTNVVAQNSGDRGIYFSPVADAGTVTLTNTSCNSNGHAGFGCQGSIANLSISGGTFNNNTGGPFQYDYGMYTGSFYGFGIELWNCVGSITGVTAAGNGFGGPDVVPLLYGLEGGAGIVVKDGSKLANNIIITCSNLQNNRNGLWIEDPDSVANWGACLAGSVAVHLSNIAGNTEYGVLNCCSAPTPISATNNWWGDASGPGGVGPGIGDAVSDNVLFYPWQHKVVDCSNPNYLLDHFKLYQVLGGAPVGTLVTLEDQFHDEPFAAMVESPVFFGNPAQKEHDGTVTEIQNPNDHLTLYGVTPLEEETQTWSVEVYNQFGDQTFTLCDPVMLGVPTRKAPHVPFVGPDHYLLYAVVDGEPLVVPVSLSDQFDGPPAAMVLEPVYFANPVSKDGSDILDSYARLVFYKIEGAPYAGEVWIQNQFGLAILDLSNPSLLAVPSDKMSYEPVPPVSLESAVYCGTGPLFGSHVGDTLTLTFSDDIFADGSWKKVTFKTATLLWEIWGNPPLSWDISGNVLTITATGVFSKPRNIVGDKVMSVTGLEDLCGDPVVVPEGGVKVEGPAVLESVVYHGTGPLFGSHVGDTLTLTFSSRIFADGSWKKVTFKTATLLWEIWGNPPMSWDISGNVLTITATSVFASPRAVVGDKVTSVKGLKDPCGKAAVVPGGGVVVASS